MANMDLKYGLAIWAYSYGRNRQEIIKGWAGVRGSFNFIILLVMHFYSFIFRDYQLIISDLLLEFYYIYLIIIYYYIFYRLIVCHLRDHVLQVQLVVHICVLVNRHLLQNFMGKG